MEILILLFRITSIFLILVMVFYGLLAIFLGGPFVPTWDRDRDAALFLAQPREGELWVDMGSGDGRLLEAAARAGARAVGWEINPLLVVISWIRLRWAGVSDRCTVSMGNFWLKDLSQADIVSVYLIHHRMPKLERKLAAELKPGARVVSFLFKLPNWEPVGYSRRVYLYVVPDRK